MYAPAYKQCRNATGEPDVCSTLTKIQRRFNVDLAYRACWTIYLIFGTTVVVCMAMSHPFRTVSVQISCTLMHRVLLLL